MRQAPQSRSVAQPRARLKAPSRAAGFASRRSGLALCYEPHGTDFRSIGLDLCDRFTLVDYEAGFGQQATVRCAIKSAPAHRSHAQPVLLEAVGIVEKMEIADKDTAWTQPRCNAVKQGRMLFARRMRDRVERDHRRERALRELKRMHVRVSQG